MQINLCHFFQHHLNHIYPAVLKKRKKIDITIFKNLVLKCNMKTLLNSQRYPFLAKHTCQTDRTYIIITLMTDVRKGYTK